MDKNFEITIKNNNLYTLKKRYDESIKEIGKSSYYKNVCKVGDKIENIETRLREIRKSVDKELKDTISFFSAMEHVIKSAESDNKISKEIVDILKKKFFLNDKLQYTRETINRGYTELLVVYYANALFGYKNTIERKNKKQTKENDKWKRVLDLVEEDIILESKKYILETDKQYVKDYDKYIKEFKKVNDIIGRIQLIADKEIMKYAEENKLEHKDFLLYSGCKTLKNGNVVVSFEDEYYSKVAEFKNNKYNSK